MCDQCSSGGLALTGFAVEWLPWVVVDRDERIVAEFTKSIGAWQFIYAHENGGFRVLHREEHERKLHRRRQDTVFELGARSSSGR